MFLSFTELSMHLRLPAGAHDTSFPERVERERAHGIPGGAQSAEGAAGRLHGRGQHEGE